MMLTNVIMVFHGCRITVSEHAHDEAQKKQRNNRLTTRDINEVKVAKEAFVLKLSSSIKALLYENN